MQGEIIWPQDTVGWGSASAFLAGRTLLAAPNMEEKKKKKPPEKNNAVDDPLNEWFPRCRAGRVWCFYYESDRSSSYRGFSRRHSVSNCDLAVVQGQAINSLVIRCLNLTITGLLGIKQCSSLSRP